MPRTTSRARGEYGVERVDEGRVVRAQNAQRDWQWTESASWMGQYLDFDPMCGVTLDDIVGIVHGIGIVERDWSGVWVAL